MNRGDTILNVAFVAVIVFVICTIAYAVHIDRSPITVTEVSPNCVVIEQAGYKHVKCFANVNVTEGDNVED
jgi:hypothetical protein